MKKNIALIFAASTLFLAGCCTERTQYEMIKSNTADVLNSPAAQAEGLVAVSFTPLPDGNYLFLVKHKPTR
jgi:protein involved in sex pheromone biosynthesis